MNKFENITTQFQVLRTRGTGEEALAMILLSATLLNNNITTKDLNHAARDGEVVSARWGKATRKLHAVEALATSISQLSETQTWVEVNDDTGNESLVFMGFAPDVEFALFAMDLAHDAMETEWRAFKATDKYTKTEKGSKRTTLRYNFMRDKVNHFRTGIGDRVLANRVDGSYRIGVKRGLIDEVRDSMPNKRIRKPRQHNTSS